MGGFGLQVSGYTNPALGFGLMAAGVAWGAVALVMHRLGKRKARAGRTHKQPMDMKKFRELRDMTRPDPPPNKPEEPPLLTAEPPPQEGSKQDHALGRSDVKRLLEAELVAGEQLRRRCSQFVGEIQPVTMVREPETTTQEVENWSDRVEGLLRKLPDSALKLARFRTEPPRSLSDLGSTGLIGMERDLYRTLSHRLNELGKIVQEL